MAEDGNSPGQLADIISPAVPLDGGDGYTWAVIVIAVAAAIPLVWLIWRWYRSQRQQGLRNIKQLRNAYRTNEITSHEACYWLAAFLKQRLRINRLSPGFPLPDRLVEDQDRWQSFLQRLHEARYAPCGGSGADIVSLLVEATYWMRRWP